MVREAVEEEGVKTLAITPLLLGWAAVMKGMGSAEKGYFLAKTGTQNVVASLQRDTLLEDVEAELSSDGAYHDGLVDVRRATAEDEYGDKAEEYRSFWEYSPTRKAGPFCDLVAELEEPLDLDVMADVAQERGYATENQVTDGLGRFGQDEEIDMLAAYEDVESWETFGERRGETYRFVEEDIYRLGGHPYSSSETEEKVLERAAFLGDYLDKR